MTETPKLLLIQIQNGSNLYRKLSDRIVSASLDSMEGVPVWAPMESDASLPRRLAGKETFLPDYTMVDVNNIIC